ncbi:bifunctional riboflavin kinase/FAD synthetase [Flavicella marina]|uniref:bifunctional riboflavin kinase/FAD synthetase n=1 Tax=Flavicella marina TaxID=1475951 RepID=UPI0012654822|nr:bifunctional riboflavin kinase/FAD synthetase [Flavicella marina]
MKVIENYKNFKDTKKSIVTIGTFDGVHIGHQKILEQLISAAKKENRNSVLLTFFPHPRMVLQKENSIKLIDTIDERIEILKKSGLDYLIIHPFDKEFSRLTAFDFVRDILVNHLNTSKLVIGYDHRFGRNREGDFEQLEEYGAMYDFSVDEIPVQDIDEISVSSTKIRKALAGGDIETVTNYLGRRYTLSGEVVRGDRLGNTIGYPTANLKIQESYKLIPKNGAYLVGTIIDGTSVYGMMNIGVRPTVKGLHQTIETHFFDFDEDLYGKSLKIELYSFLREEQKFDSVESLKLQLSKDKIKSLSMLKTSQI